VIAPDFIGNGDSDKIDAPVDIATLARDALSVADALGLQRFDLWGTHTGALIAMEAAIIAPQRVGRVILEAPPLLAPEFTADLLANYFPPLVPDGWGLYLQQAWNMRRDMFLFWPWYRAERAAARPLNVPDAAFLHDWTVGLLTSGSTYHRSYRAAFEYDTRARMPLLTRPALVCAGPADMLADGLQAARSLLGADAVVSPTPATVWYPDQGADAIAQTIAAYERFLDSA
jgi:pimeloyl-ACP methyl ester carboxylesterase